LKTVPARFSPILRRVLLALLLSGVAGLEGCSKRFHQQHARAIGGGTIGKGPSGKKRGIAQTAQQNGRIPGLGGDPMADLFGAKARNGNKRKLNPLEAARTRAKKPPKVANPFATKSSGPFGNTNPFDQR
jgi:hypothetical protein